MQDILNKNVFETDLISVKRNNQTYQELYSQHISEKHSWDVINEFTEPSNLKFLGEDYIPLVTVFISTNFSIFDGDYKVNTPRYLTKFQLLK